MTPGHAHPRRVTADERRARLARRHHLAPSAAGSDALTVAGDLVGLHASDPSTVFLSAWARVPGLTVADVERELYDERSLVRHLCMRRTLFVVPRDLVAVTQVAVTDRVAATIRKRLASELEREGVAADGDAWLTAVIGEVVDAVARLGPSTGAQLAKAVPLLQSKLRGFGDVAASVTPRIITLAAAEGHLERGRPQGTWASSTHRWQTALAPAGLPDKRAALAELVRRWLVAFGPAERSDIVWWTGLGVTDIKAALAVIDTVDVDLDGRPGVVLADDAEPAPAVEPWVALLPSLDPTPMGWKARHWYLGEHADRLFDRSGNIGPTVWSNGRAVGGWAVRPGDKRSGAASVVVTELFERLDRATTRAIGDRASELEAWLDGAVVTPRFPTPLDRRLRAPVADPLPDV